MVFWVSIAISVFAIFKSKDTYKINHWDALFLLSSWQVFNLGYWQKYLATTAVANPYNIAAVILILLSIWFIHRRKINLGKVEFSKKSALIAILSLGILTKILIPAGLLLGFLKFNPRLEPNHIISTAIGYYLFVAPSEELIFRGIIFNLLERHFNKWPALFTSTALFAVIYTHLSGNSTFPNWQYVGMAFIAGLVYGISYMKSRNILVPIFIHGSVDTIWRIFLS
ncbi:MAG: CPBP family intramembrane metalloprotease [Candidatus Harrisonbacteria bacterium]|nr:CPBP family intramembrane metalloprotease [Candidatus Harrisonbacteria bacterium]